MRACPSLALAAVRADDPATVPVDAILARNPGVDRSRLEPLIFGAADQAGEDNLARRVVPLSDRSGDRSGLTAIRLCASGKEAVVASARQIRCGEGNFVITDDRDLDASSRLDRLGRHRAVKALRR